MEVIARKKNKIWGYFLTMTIILAILFVASFLILLFGIPSENAGFIIYIPYFFALFFGVASVGWLYRLIRYLIAPKVIITIEDQQLRFSDGLQCVPSEITDVTYQFERLGLKRYWGTFYWGTLLVKVGKTEHIYRYVAEVEQVYDRLRELIYRAKKEEKAND